jgi:hypothetical protein
MKTTDFFTSCFAKHDKNGEGAALSNKGLWSGVKRISSDHKGAISAA